MSNTGKYKKIDTYFYDYHALKISLETSIIRKECIEDEIKVFEDIDPNAKEIKSLRSLLIARENIINIQRTQLKKMKEVLDGFPKTLREAEYDVYYMSVVENKSVDEISNTLCFTAQYIREIRSKLIDKFTQYKRIIEG